MFRLEMEGDSKQESKVGFDSETERSDACLKWAKARQPRRRCLSGAQLWGMKDSPAWTDSIGTGHWRRGLRKWQRRIKTRIGTRDLQAWSGWSAIAARHVDKQCVGLGAFCSLDVNCLWTMVLIWCSSSYCCVPSDYFVMKRSRLFIIQAR
jgi:hypothetical protein